MVGTVDQDSWVYCAPFASGDVPVSTDDITRPQLGSRTVDLDAAVLVPELEPATTYDIYCMAVSVQSASHADLVTVLTGTGKVVASTQCCKDVTVAWDVVSLREGEFQVAGVSVTLSHLPSASMLISFQVDSSQGGQVALNPSDISVWADSSIMTYSADVVAILHGNTSVATKISGSSSGEYTLLPSPNTPHLLLVQSAQEPPPVPHVTSVTFANDAASVVVVFSGNTDRGGRNNALFSCSLLLSFVDADSSQCQWGSHKRLSIYPPASVGVDDVVVVVADSIRAECTVSNTPCQQWATVVPDPALWRRWHQS